MPVTTLWRAGFTTAVSVTCRSRDPCSGNYSSHQFGEGLTYTAYKLMLYCLVEKHAIPIRLMTWIVIYIFFVLMIFNLFICFCRFWLGSVTIGKKYIYIYKNDFAYVCTYMLGEYWCVIISRMPQSELCLALKLWMSARPLSLWNRYPIGTFVTFDCFKCDRKGHIARFRDFNPRGWWNHLGPLLLTWLNFNPTMDK